MARSHLTLAALATSAVPELDLVEAAPFGSAGAGDFDSALLTGKDGRHWIVRVPRRESAEAEQSADLVALRALTTGVRSRLPFEVATFAGQAPVGSTRAVVYQFVYGSKASVGALDLETATSIGAAIAAIHGLPTSFVTEAGLPVQSAQDSLRASTSIMDRAAATGLVPAALLQRWELAADDAGLWQFQPTVINGSLAAGSFLLASEKVTGVLGWHGLRVGDPARDLQWLIALRREGLADAAFDAYADGRGTIDRRLRQRAMLLSELEVARWLLHGTDTRSTEIVDDAVSMLSGLVDDVQNDMMSRISAQTMPILAVDEVEDLLDRAEHAPGVA